MKSIYDGRWNYEIVDKFPKGYEVWNIGAKNFIDGYLPLCRASIDYNVDVATLKAVKVQDNKAIMEVAGYGLKTPEKLLAKINKPTGMCPRMDIMLEALEMFRTVEFE